MHFRPALSLLVAIAGLSSFASAGENLVKNPGFESGPNDWKPYMSKDAEAKGAAISGDATVAHSGKASLRMFCPVDERYSAGPSLSLGNIKPGERYKVSAWVRAGDDFVQKPGVPGFHIRATLFAEPGKDAPGGHYHFGPDGRALRNAGMHLLAGKTLPNVWTEIGGVFEIPEGATRLTLNLFVERGSGSVFIDDVSLVKVSETTPTTPLINASR